MNSTWRYQRVDLSLNILDVFHSLHHLINSFIIYPIGFDHQFFLSFKNLCKIVSYVTFVVIFRQTELYLCVCLGGWQKFSNHTPCINQHVSTCFTSYWMTSLFEIQFLVNYQHYLPITDKQNCLNSSYTDWKKLMKKRKIFKMQS